VPVTTSAWLMLQRNLLYTAVTRARRIVVLVGSRRALAKAVRTHGAATATPPSLNGSNSRVHTTHTKTLIERIPWAPTVGRDLGKGRSAQRLALDTW
jgi:hypothetical protein